MIIESDKICQDYYPPHQYIMSQLNNALLHQHEGRLQLALQAYNIGQFRGYRAAATAFNVNHHTLSKHAKGILFRPDTKPNRQKITTTEEQTIIQYILDFDS
ncbi:hypothetical protein GQ44DRAFT_718483 [Phaeosphaeriaceae sp. PMI808]|nr:hypothetical protein GQ44DRAFT_718483 [Phaeosphaeriaceae sp. PMI808]